MTPVTLITPITSEPQPRAELELPREAAAAQRGRHSPCLGIEHAAANFRHALLGRNRSGKADDETRDDAEKDKWATSHGSSARGTRYGCSAARSILVRPWWWLRSSSGRYCHMPQKNAGADPVNRPVLTCASYEVTSRVPHLLARFIHPAVIRSIHATYSIRESPEET